MELRYSFAYKMPRVWAGRADHDAALAAVHIPRLRLNANQLNERHGARTVLGLGRHCRGTDVRRHRVIGGVGPESAEVAGHLVLDEAGQGMTAYIDWCSWPSGRKLSGREWCMAVGGTALCLFHWRHTQHMVLVSQLSIAFTIAIDSAPSLDRARHSTAARDDGGLSLINGRDGASGVSGHAGESSCVESSWGGHGMCGWMAEQAHPRLPTSIRSTRTIVSTRID